MLKSDLVQTDKHSIKYFYGGKISDFYVAQILYKTVARQHLRKTTSNVKTEKEQRKT